MTFIPDADETYWVVVIYQHTGKVWSQGPYPAEQAHRVAADLRIQGVVRTIVVGKV